MEKPRIYFGHTVNLYGTTQEADFIGAIQHHFPHMDVENPAQPEHDQGYERYKAMGRRGMEYFFEEVLPAMEAGVFLPFEDGKWGTGVFGEAQCLHNLRKPIYSIDWLREIKAMDLRQAIVLTIEETRQRVYGPAKSS